MLTRKRADPGLKLKSNIYIRDHETQVFILPTFLTVSNLTV